MLIRQATREDLDGVLKCFQELNKEHVDYFSRRRVKWLLKSKSVVVCENEQVGILGAIVVRDGAAFQIFAISVHPAFQNKGIGVGSKLLRFSEAMARACGREVIYADSYAFYNASPFYLKNGYGRQDNGNWGYTFFKYQEISLPLVGGLDN